jgi:hypothetical protein
MLRQALLLLLAVVLAYGIAARNRFLWFDEANYEAQPGSNALGRVFLHADVVQGRHTVTYRPLTALTFAVEKAGGRRPVLWHIDNLLLHLVNALLLLGLARRLGFGSTGAAISALLFAAHPAISEPVYWLSARNDLLATMFFLAAWAVWLAGSNTLTALAMAMACLSKESAWLMALGLVPFVRPLVTRRLGDPRRALLPLGRDLLRSLVPFAAGGALAFGMRLAAVRRLGLPSGHLSSAALVQMLFDALRSLALPLPALPKTLGEAYGGLTFGGLHLGLVYGVLAGSLVFAIVRSWRGKWLWLLFLFELFLLVLPLLFLGSDPAWFGWGRFLYSVAPFFCLAVGNEWGDLVTRGRASLANAGNAVWLAAAAVLAVETAWMSTRFHDPMTLGEALVQENPDDSLGYATMAGEELEQKKNLAQAVAHAQAAVRLGPQNPQHWAILVRALKAAGRADVAQRSLKSALLLFPDDPGLLTLK